jgi:atypical dual specificity phosphatase
MYIEKLNFSWLVPGEVAGHRAPESVDDLDYLKSKGVTVLVRMIEQHKAKVTMSQVVNHGFIDVHEPVIDFEPPSQIQIDKMIESIKQYVAKGRLVGVSCHAGKGRTGTILACYLVSKCLTAEQALAELKKRRGVGPDTPSQEEAVRTYAKRLGKS